MQFLHRSILLSILAGSLLTGTVFAQEGAALFKTKCAACHGAEGQGKVGPALKGTSLTSDQIADLLTKGNDAKKPPHKKPVASLSADDAKSVAAFVKNLK